MHNLFATLATKVASAMRYEQSQSCCMGGDIHFAYNHHGTLAYLIETGTAFQPPAPVMRQELPRVYSGILEMLAEPIAVSGKVVDKRTKKPLKAVLKVQNMGFKLHESSTTGATGMYHLWVPQGKWNVAVSAEGYPVHNFVVKVTKAGLVRNLELAKATKKQAEAMAKQRAFARKAAEFA